MPFVWNKEVTSYKVDVFAASTLSYDRSIRLELVDGDTVAVSFPGSPPSDYVSIGSSFHQVQLASHKFDEIYHMLQTENPVYFTAYETGSPAIRFVGFSTSTESVGEGFVDSDA
ncbi:hypothetical protein [Agrococcus sp. ProA11]|uniref:hypothetical protein n=1 Tax=Agrococcus chionoecetis TaxID=3153752 RepID=UPI00326111D6